LIHFYKRFRDLTLFEIFLIKEGGGLFKGTIFVGGDELMFRLKLVNLRTVILFQS